MLSLVNPAPGALSDREMAFYTMGFDCFPKGEGALCFRQFFLVQELKPLLATRLKRMGIHPEDTISICFSESDNVVSACVLKRDFYIEHDADSPAGIGLLWGFGIEIG